MSAPLAVSTSLSLMNGVAGVGGWETGTDAVFWISNASASASWKCMGFAGVAQCGLMDPERIRMVWRLVWIDADSDVRLFYWDW